VRILAMTREHSPILTEYLAGGIAKVVLNNPPLNVVTLRMSERLLETMNELEGDASVRAVVLSGAGHKAFARAPTSRNSHL
jgi:enoyl-CoA hydratase